MFQATGDQGTETGKRGRKETFPLLVEKVTGLTLASASMVSEVASVSVSSAWNWTKALMIVAPEGTVILDAAKREGIFITNLCSSPKLKPFAACRTCMVETVTDGKKELVYSCTQPIAEGMAVRTNTEETDRYNKSCLEMLLVEHPLDCPICDKSGVCPLQDNTDALLMHSGRFEIARRNEPSIKTNPIPYFYLNLSIRCAIRA